MVGSSHSCPKNEKKFIDVTWPVISGFALGRKNEFQTKMGNFDAGVFSFFFNWTGGILARCDFDNLNLFRY